MGRNSARTMGYIDDLANDPEWQRTLDEPIFSSIVKPPAYFESKSDITIDFWRLGNGLLYAVPKNKDGRILFKNASYPINDEEEISGHYHLVNLATRRTRERPGFFATFRFDSNQQVHDSEEATIEYTVWHNPVIGETGLTTLISLYAMQNIDDEWAEFSFNAENNRPDSRYLTARIVPANAFGGDVAFDREGRMQAKVPFGAGSDIVGGMHPFERVYEAVTRGIELDALKTAQELIKAFPARRPLDMQQLVHYR